MRAWLNLRHTHDQRAALFERGLTRLGYQPIHGLPSDPAPGDIFVTWNRIGAGNNIARLFEARGLPVLVVENATWGNQFAGQHWYHIARSHHNTAGCFAVGGAHRWGALNQPLAQWRKGGQTVILPQRGIGSDPVKMPSGFIRRALKDHGGWIRPHPGTKPSAPLDVALANCSKAVTWGSGAAIKALMMGVAVISYMPHWVGEQDNTDAGRLKMFERLAWGQWRHAEIENGDALDWLLNR